MIDVLDKIKNLKEKRGWSTYRLSKETGIASSTLRNMYIRNTMPSIPTLETICDGFGITLSQFFSDENGQELDVRQLEMLNIWNKLDEGQKESLLVLMKNMIDK
ncbi:MAG: helix-turn-helix domain-containing protein [Lachnospiraceae bacterium]